MPVPVPPRPEPQSVPEILDLWPDEVRPFDLLDEGRIVIAVDWHLGYGDGAIDAVVIHDIDLAFIERAPGVWDLSHENPAEHRYSYATTKKVRVVRGVPLRPPVRVT